MPTYTIHDTKKDEYFDTICTWGELEEFLDNNPQCRYYRAKQSAKCCKET